MNLKQESDVEIDKILDKMFIYADNKDLNINRIRNLIVNPEILRVLLHQLANMNNNQKIHVLRRVADIYKKNSLNVCILLKRDKQIMQFNHSIFDEIVTFLFNIKLELQQNQTLFQTVKPLISGYLIGSRNIKNIINKIARNFHYQNFNLQKLQLCLLILKQIYRGQIINNSFPKCYFYMYGPNSGIRMIGQDLKWTLNKGMYFYINFCMESYRHQEMNLLNIHINDDSFQLCISQQNYLTVKVFSATKVAKLRKIQQKKWYFLKMAYCLKTGIIRNSYQFVVHLEGEPFQLRDLPIPSPTIKDSIQQLIIGHQFYGKINVAAISRSQIHYWPKNGVNNWSQIQGLLAGNKQALKDIFLFYSPLIRSKLSQNQIIYEITSKNHAQILDNTAIHNNPFDEVDINYYGGLYTLIPFIYILRFYKYGVYQIALQETLDLFVLLFRSGYQNIQNQAINCQFFGILAQFMNQIDQRYISVQVIEKIAQFKDLIELKSLRKQYLQNFLLKIRIDRIKNLKVIQKLHKLISSLYYKDFTWAVQTSSLYQIIWYMIDNFEPQVKQQCCMLHCWEQSPFGIDDQKIEQINQHYKTKCQYLKQLIRYIIKTLCSTRRYDLLLQKNIDIQQITYTANKRSQNFSIFQFLKFQQYSICLKKLLLQCIQVGAEQDPRTLIKDTQLLQCMFGLLEESQLRDQITPVVSILYQCSKVLSITKDAKNLQIIKQIGKQLDKIYMKKYAAVRLRSKSEGISIKKTFSQRKMSNQMQDSQSHSTETTDQTKQKQKDIKSKIIKLKRQKQIKVSNDRQLYDLLIGICCTRQLQSGDIVLVDDDSTKIINPYFRICCSKFKVKLIDIIRTTVLVRSKIEHIPPKMESLAKFDQVYRFILSEFILKQLDPDDSNYKPTEQSMYVIKNFFFILDNMVIGMKNNWDSLYLFILRMIGLLTQAKKDIHKKTQRSKQEILLASKVCVRKFLLRVLKYAEKSIQNMGNMVFLVYLVVFNNPEPIANQQNRLFDYFQSLQQNFFIGPIAIKNQDDIQMIPKNIYVDQRIILVYLDGFKMDQVFSKDDPDPTKRRKYITILIKAYFQLQQSNQLQDYLFKLRKVFLSRSQFKDINLSDNKGIRSMISNYFINSSDNKSKQNNQSYDLYVAQIIGLLLCLTVQSSINTDRFDILKQALQKYALFIKSFSLACSRDCLKKKQHQFRNQKLPTKIVYHLIHFLYEMMQTNCNQQCKTQVQDTIYDIINFQTILMSVLSQKVGNPGTLDDALMLSAVMQDVQQYNFFSFKILEGVITLNQIRVFPTLQKQKCQQYLNHVNMKKHFKIPPKVFLQKHIKEAVQIHKHNIEKIQKQLEQKFEQGAPRSRSNTNTLKSSTTSSQQSQFQQYRLDHARKLNFQYRNMMKVWRKVWKRLRLYHYYWSVSMDQREQMKVEWKKMKSLPYKHKFGKYTDLDGLRPILQVQPNQPWHVRKAEIEEELQYRAKNFMVNLYKSKGQKNVKTKSFIDRFILRKSAIFNTQFNVQWIKHNSKRKGRLSLTKQKLIFQYDSTFQKDSHVDFTSFTLAEHRPTQKLWNLVTISNIIKRRYLMRVQCLLIQFQDSSSIIFDFLDDDSNQFLQKIAEIQAQKSEMANFMKANKVTFYTKNFKRTNYDEQIERATQQWTQGHITNLQYLMILNKYSGRSYLDPVNYPVLPWILNSYEFKQLEYRDLSKTLGSLGSQTRKQFYEHKVQAVDPFNNVPPYQYGTHYSSPGVLFNFMIRISPYTEAARTLQGGKFDLSDRLFSSIKVCWHSVRNQVSDVRQLNPQFFYLPEFLINIDNHDFGITQLKQRIDNVKLPLWAANAYQFIFNHRRALQSDEVSTNINNWIDLIFGYKQKGKIARQNLNLYYYLTYEDSINLNKIDDPVQRTSIQAQIIHFGQTPSQIFTKPHPQKKFLKSSTPYSEPQKIKFLGLHQSAVPILLLGQIDNNNLLVFNDSTLLTIALPGFQTKSSVSLLRNTSKQNLYYVQDISVNNKIILFGNNRFVAVSSYVNGDLVIYNINGKKVHQKKGMTKSFIYINKKQNLLLCGCKNGLLQVYQIVYAQKDSVNLIKIISQYYMFPIEHISEGAGFFSISSGNLVIINKITRGLNYVYDKVKMQGTKMIRSFQSKRKVFGSFICTNPLYCVVFFNSLEVYIYSINGQFLKLRQIQNLVTPVIMVDYMQRQNILVLQPNGLLVLKVPELETVCSIPVPNKEYIDMKMIKDKLYLITNHGEILYFFNQKDVIFY